jgi:hypothetical protein
MPSPYEPADGVKFMILTTSERNTVGITDNRAGYVDLPPGQWVSRSPLGFTKDLPTEVAIAEIKKREWTFV